ncbi:putative sodium-dependent multivitamin transporter [Rhipicephalus microplus]|uniref:putative sodium-dependent multivitamin transporter n=1 Tax=Rhipicephalus microplus TaxID=6941 RepID=UPI003F6A9DC3
MSSEKSLDTADCVVFGVLTAVGYIVGIYFSFARRRQKLASSDGDVPGADYEAFLGGQSLPSVALAVSVVASVANGMNVVGFVGHYYAYGFHALWILAGTAFATTFAVVVMIPLLYRLRVASIFQYLRMRFDNKVGITASVVYFVLSQTLGAVGIYSAAIGLATMLSVPLLYSNIAIGVAGTIYTALGGLRGVVWADCVQALVMFLAPLTIIVKVLYDSSHVEPALRPMSDLNVTEYMFRVNLNLTLDENIWSCFIGGLPYIFVRVGFDQMVVQRFMAARSEHDAKRIAVVSSVFVVFFFFIIGVAGGTIIYWYRDCDPLLSGAIKNYDQVVPYYLKQSLSEVTAMRGLFLAGLLGATTSTVSSVVNSHAATFYIDVIAPYYKLSEEKALIVMRLLAFASGAIMTLFAIAVPALGTATRLFLNFYASASGPFSALVILAVTSPWVNSKGAAWASLVVCAFQLWHAVGRSMSSVGKPPVFPGTLDRCPTPQNVTVEAARNLYNTDTQSAYVFPLYRLSFFWSSFFGALLTITLAVVLSFATGGIQKSQKKVRFVSPLFTEFWKKLKLVGEEYEVNAPMTLNGVVSSGNKSDEDERMKLGTEMFPVCKERSSSEVTIVHASECRT